MYIVMTDISTKEAWLQIRIREDLKEETRVLADHLGLTMSALVSMLLKARINVARSESPHIFREHAAMSTRPQHRITSGSGT